MFGRRILILVPHPDDEVVACAATIGRAQKDGADIFALYLTNGCIARETLWPWQRKHADTHAARRYAEGSQAADFINIKPVGWAARPARHLWREMGAVSNEIHAAVAAHAIDQLWVPAYEGGNADHDAVNAIAARWMEEKRGQGIGNREQKKVEDSFSSVPSPLPPVLEFAEYNFANGKTHSQEFPAPNGSEKIIMLTPEEKNKKRAALDIYKSERLNLNYVETDRECHRPLATYDYSRPPHPGTVWYARFQWVPFRHPRVDFTRPQEVCAAIASFMGR